jgi:hypothetical protein
LYCVAEPINHPNPLPLKLGSSLTNMLTLFCKAKSDTFVRINF